MALTLQQLKDYRLPIISQPLTRVTTVNELATTNLFEALGSVVGNYEALNPNGSIATTSAISSLWSTGGTTEVDIHTSTFVTGGYYLNNGVLYPQYGNFAITAGNPPTDPQFAQIQFNGIGQYIHIEAYDPSEEGKGLCMTVDNTAITISDSNDGPLGLRYQDDYSANIINQDRSIPDVGTVNQLISAGSGSLGTGFINGGSAGTIPGSTNIVIGDTTTFRSYDTNNEYRSDLWFGLSYTFDGNPEINAGRISLTTGIPGNDDHFSQLTTNGELKSITLAGYDVSSNYSATLTTRGSKYTSGSLNNTAGIMSISTGGGLGYFAELALDGTTDSLKLSAYETSGGTGVNLYMTADSTRFYDTRSHPVGIEYGGDYTTYLIGNDRSIPDVRIVKQLISNNAYSGKILADSYSGTGTATTAFTVTIGATQANNIYKLSLAPTSLLAMTSYYVSAKTTTTFTITYASALTGAVTFDWVLHP